MFNGVYKISLKNCDVSDLLILLIEDTDKDISEDNARKIAISYANSHIVALKPEDKKYESISSINRSYSDASNVICKKLEQNKDYVLISAVSNCYVISINNKVYTLIKNTAVLITDCSQHKKNNVTVAN